MGAVPVLASVRVRGVGEPTAMVPKLRLAGLIWRWDWAPLPVREAVRGRAVREVASERVPVRVPGSVGVKAIWRVQLVEGAAGGGAGSGGGVVSGGGDAVEDGGGGADVGDLDGEARGDADEDVAEVERGGGEDEVGGGGVAEEADEVEGSAGVGGDLEGG